MVVNNGYARHSRRKRELLVSQPMLRHIARRAAQVAIVAFGVLAVLLLFSRQAHASNSPPSAATPATPQPAASTAPATPATPQPAASTAPAPAVPATPQP